MSALKTALTLVLATGTTAAFAEQVTCESHQDGLEACTTILAGSQVRIVKQLSDAPCVEGKSWGVDTTRNSVWTSAGCMAVFDVKPPQDDPNAKRHEVKHS